MAHFEPQYPLHGVDDDGGYTEMQLFIHGHEGPGARLIGNWLMEKLNPASVIDLGCGPGVYLIPFTDAGVEVLGVDACPASGADLPEGAFVRWDLRYPFCPPHRFDLALFCEVGEHLERHWSERLVDTCFDCSDVLLVTWAVPGQGGHRHVNEQSHEWVLSIFRERHGYTLHPLQNEWRAFVESLPDAAEGMNPPADAPAGIPGWLKRNSFLLWRSPELRASEPWSEPPWTNEPQAWLGGKTWREIGCDPVGSGMDWAAEKAKPTPEPPAGDIQCFLIEPTNQVTITLHYEADGPCAANDGGKHRSSTVKTAAGENAREMLAATDKASKQAKGPKCACGFQFKGTHYSGGGTRTHYKRADAGELIPSEGPFPVGAIWRASWREPHVVGADGKCYNVMTPGGEWCIDSRASNCTRPDDNTHKCWVRHGEAPNFTVDKNGDTCQAGAGSILCGDYHGFLRNGILVRA